MATMAADPVFVDTNVLVFARIPSAPFHAEASKAMNRVFQSGAALRISRQIIREFISTVTKPLSFSKPFDSARVAVEVENLEQAALVADETADVTRQLLALLAAIPCGGKQVHDANIVATMLVHGIPNLLTHNIADFQRFGHLITIIPLVP
jgi:predicted nucleic acid-binding protein